MHHIRQLEKLGLTNKEARVYVATLSLSHGTVTEIAKKADLPKSTVSDVLKALNTKGLVTTYKKHKRTHFSISSPDIFEERVEKQTEIVTQLIPELHAIYNTSPDKPRIRFFEGAHGLEVIMREILKEARDLAVVSSPGDVLVALPEHFPRFTKLRAKHKIPLRILYQDSPKAREWQLLDQTFLRQSKIIRSPIPFTSILWLWNNKCALTNFKNQSMSVILEDKDMVCLIRALFELTWGNA